MVSGTLTYVFYLYFALSFTTPATELVAKHSVQMQYAQIGRLTAYRAYYPNLLILSLLHHLKRYATNIKMLLQQSARKIALYCTLISKFVPYGKKEVSKG